MSKRREGEPAVTRRAILQGVGTLTAAQLLAQVGCSRTALDGGAFGAASGGAGHDGPGSDDLGGAGGGSPASGGTGEESSTGGASDAGGTGGTAPTGPQWATGGTAVMTGLYPDPFDDMEPLDACVLTCQSTLGPCYAETLLRKDISEGHDGLPMRLALRLVDEGCQPLAQVAVDVWHTAPEGMYSGEETPELCNKGNADALASRWFRGAQFTDERGRVDFDTCFPGWYVGRTIHIHFTVRIGDTVMTSQLFFQDELCDQIVATEPLYNDRGPRDANNVTDGVSHGSSRLPPLLLETQRMPDGVMLAYKTLVLRSTPNPDLCVL